MSNSLAIATVTAALGAALQKAAVHALEGVQVDISTRRPREPDNPQAGPQVNLFLYQVLPNAAWRSADLPTRRGDGSLVQRPQAALDLNYLLTFYGDERALVPQRMLGGCVVALHARPLLTREAIRSLIRSAQNAAATNNYLSRSDLAGQVELVRFSPLPLNLEELSKLWSVFFQTAYALSVAYQASVVLIEEEEEAPQPALPVRSYNVRAVPFSQPSIEQVLPAEGEHIPITSGSTLVLRGQRLVGEVTTVLISGAEATPQGLSPTEIRVRLPSLPAGILLPGLDGAQVVHKRRMPGSATLIGSGESEVAAFVLRPLVTELSAVDVPPPPQPPPQPNPPPGNQPRMVELVAQLDPTPGERQRVMALLNPASTPAGSTSHAYSFPSLGITGKRMVFAQAGDDPAIRQLGLDTAAQTWGVWSRRLAGFGGLSQNPAHLQLSIGADGPFDVTIAGAPNNLDAARSALEAGIRAAGTSPTFTAAQVIRLGERLLVLPGTSGGRLVFSPAGNDPAISELGLAGPTPVWGVYSGSLAAFGGVSRVPAHLLVTIGDKGPYLAAIADAPNSLDAARSELEAGLRAAHDSSAFKNLEVVRGGDRLLVIPGFDILFDVSAVVPGDYLVRIKVDGAESPLAVDANPASPTYDQYSGPKVTIP